MPRGSAFFHHSPGRDWAGAPPGLREIPKVDFTMGRSMGRSPSAGIVVTTKITVPPTRSPILHRTRLYEVLHDALRRRLVVVAAGAGFGKTTLVSAFVHALRVSAAWYRLDAADADPATFTTHLFAALRGRLKRGSLPAPGLVRDWPTAARIVVDLLGRLRGDVLVVLDDYHLLPATPAIRAGITFLISNLPPTAHVAILTRTQPDLPLARWLAEEAVVQLGPDDLRFTPAELRDLLVGLHGLGLSDAALHMLAARTEGWAAGVVLVLHALTQRQVGEAVHAIAGLSGTSREIYDYLAQEAFDRQSPSIQRFLRATSVLTRFSADLADRFLGVRTTRAVLQAMERQHLFLVPLDGQRRWYRYHHLFQEFLQARLQEDEPEALASYHLRAARAWEGLREAEPGDLGPAREAIGHYLAAQRHDDAARLLEHDGERFWAAGAFEMLRGWVATLPPSAQQRHPRVAILAGLLLRQAGRAEEAITRLEEAEMALRATGDLPGYAQAASFLAQTYLWKPAGDRLAALADHIPDPAGFPAHARWRVLEVLAAARHAEGRLDDAASLLAEALAVARASLDLWGVQRAGSALAEVRAEQGAFAEALEICQEYYNQMRAARWGHEWGHAAADHSHLLLQVGRWDRAAPLVDEAANLSRQAPCQSLASQLTYLRGLLVLQQGHLSAAQAQFDEALRQAERFEARIRILARLGLARVHAMTDDRPHAVRHARDAVHLARRFRLPDYAASLLLLGTLEEDEQVVRHAAELASRCGARPTLCHGLWRLAVLRRRHHPGEARACAQEALEIAASPQMAGFLHAVGALRAAQEFLRDDVVGPRVVDLLRTVSPPAVPVRLHVLGQFRLLRGDHEVPGEGFRRRAVRQLLKYLAIQRRPVRREEILEALWPEHDPSAAAAALKVALSELRRVLEPERLPGHASRLLSSGATVRLNPTGLWIDFQEFEDRLAHTARETGPARRRSLEAAVALYAGDLLPEDAYEQWTHTERAHLRRSYLQALADLATLQETVDAREAAATWQRVLDAEPGTEAAWQGLIRRALARGQRAEAARLYARCREVLREELGVEPSEETSRLLPSATDRPGASGLPI